MSQHDKQQLATRYLRCKKGYDSCTICFVALDFYSSTRSSSLVETEKKLWLGATVSNGELRCGVLFQWSKVEGLEAISSSNHLISVTNSDQDKRVIIWWKTSYAKECKTEIWCAQILIQVCDHMTMSFRGYIEWSENVFTFQGSHESVDDSQFLLHSALVTHDF